MRMKLIYLCLAVLTALFSGCQKGGSGSSPDPSAPSETPVPVDALTSSMGKLVEYIEASGQVRGHREAYVVSETQGIVQEINFELGSAVRKGDILLRVDDSIQALTMEQAAVQLDNARLELNAAERLMESGSASQLQLNRARSAVRGAEAAYKSAVKNYENCRIKAPIDGYIVSRESSAAQGNLISPGTMIAMITDTQKLRMTLNLGEGEVGLIDKGMPASVTVPACGRSAEGKVEAIAAGSDPATGSFRVIVEWENDCGTDIKSGMTGSATIPVTRGEEKIIVPRQAVISEADEEYLFTAGDIDEAGNGTAVMKKVETGGTLGGRTEILSGIGTGEHVIISSVSRLSDGKAVTVTIAGSSSSWR